MWSSCTDNPNGEVRVEVSGSQSHQMGNFLNLMMEVKAGSYLDSEDERKVAGCPNDQFTKAKPIDISESLFTGKGGDICQACARGWKVLQWAQTIKQKIKGGHTHMGSRQDPSKGNQQCKAIAENIMLDERAPTAEELCTANSVSMDHAKEACDHMKGKGGFFESCVYDVCATNEDGMADNAAAEEVADFPEPMCVQEGDCDPQAICCDEAAQRGLNLQNVVQNNLDGSGKGPREVRYSGVQDGVDLVITSADYSSKAGNKGNGAKGKLGQIALDVGSSHNFDFSFVKSGTNEPASPGNVVMSFLDIDQGKKNKQRESLKICGVGSPIVTTNTELESSVADGCSMVQSTQRGTGSDNPDDPDLMDDTQRARSVAFPIQGKSTFSVELAVSAKGRQGRGFLFTGSPTVACQADA